MTAQQRRARRGEENIVALCGHAAAIDEKGPVGKRIRRIDEEEMMVPPVAEPAQHAATDEDRNDHQPDAPARVRAQRERLTARHSRNSRRMLRRMARAARIAAPARPASPAYRPARRAPDP